MFSFAVIVDSGVQERSRNGWIRLVASAESGASAESSRLVLCSPASSASSAAARGTSRPDSAAIQACSLSTTVELIFSKPPGHGRCRH
jgi:hypothetical protein